MAAKKQPKTHAAKNTAESWYVIKNTVTGEKSITDETNWKYAQKHEPKAHQWKKISSVLKSEEEAIAAL